MTSNLFLKQSSTSSLQQEQMDSYNVNNKNNVDLNSKSIDELNDYFIKDNPTIIVDEACNGCNGGRFGNGDIDYIKINLNNGYFISGQNVTGNIEISLNNEITTSGINLKWKVFEKVLINHYHPLNYKQQQQQLQQLQQSNYDFEIIEPSNSLKSSTNSFKSSYKNGVSGNGTLKRNSKILNALKNSSSISSFLKMSPSFSSSLSFSSLSGIAGGADQLSFGNLIDVKKENKLIYSSDECIYSTDDTGGNMSSGIHIIPFSFIIPSHCPSSFSDFTIDKETNDKIIAAILYSITISFNEPSKSLESECLELYKPSMKKHFSVCEPTIIASSINEIPLKMEKKKSFLITSGYLNMKVFLKRNVFFAGEQIPIQLKIENSTSRNIDYILISIKKIQNLLITKKSGSVQEGASGDSGTVENAEIISKKCSIKSSEKHNGVDAHSNFDGIISFDTKDLKLTNQSTNGNLIKCEYKLVVQCIIKRAFNVVIRLPILIGYLPDSNSSTSVFNDDYKLNLLNM